MTSKFEIKGLWFLPQNKDVQVPGTLTFDPTEGAYLELIGSFDQIEYIYFENSSKFEIILGISVDSDLITLYNCFRSSRKGKTFKRNQLTGPPSERYFANFILKGYHFESEESLQFDTIKSSVQNLDEWLNITGFLHEESLEKLTEKSISLEYKLPEDINFNLHKDFSGKFTFSTTTPTYQSNKHEFITQVVEIELKSNTKISLEEIRKTLTRFQNFLILGVYRSCFPNTIILYNKDIQNDFGRSGKFRRPIEFYQRLPKRQSVKERQPFEMLFNYTQIKDIFPLAIKSWFERYEKLAPAFNLLFEQFYNGSKFTENTFLNLAQSAETLHSRLYNHTKVPKVEYNKMKENILKSVSEEYHNWLNDQFIFGNSLNLHTRLSELFEKYNNSMIDEAIKDREEFIVKVKHLRNYYTHYTSDLEKKLISERDLMFLTERLKMLLVSGFLIEIGFPKEKVDELFKKAKYQLFDHLVIN